MRAVYTYYIYYYRSMSQICVSARTEVRTENSTRKSYNCCNFIFFENCLVVLFEEKCIYQERERKIIRCNCLWRMRVNVFFCIFSQMKQRYSARQLFTRYLINEFIICIQNNSRWYLGVYSLNFFKSPILGINHPIKFVPEYITQIT